MVADHAGSDHFSGTGPHPIRCPQFSRCPHDRHFAGGGFTWMTSATWRRAARIWSATPSTHDLSSSVFSTRCRVPSPVTMKPCGGRTPVSSWDDPVAPPDEVVATFDPAKRLLTGWVSAVGRAL